MAVDSTQAAFIGLGTLTVVAVLGMIFQFSGQFGREGASQASSIKSIDDIFGSSGREWKGGRRTRKSKSGNRKTKRSS